MSVRAGKTGRAGLAKSRWTLFPDKVTGIDKRYIKKSKWVGVTRGAMSCVLQRNIPKMTATWSLKDWSRL